MNEFSLTCRVSFEMSDPVWDAFVARKWSGNHEQTSLWAQAKSQVAPWSAARLIFEQKDGIVAGAQVLLRRVGSFGTIGYVPKGPVGPLDELGWQRRLAVSLANFGNELGLGYLVLDLPYEAHGLTTGLDRAGFRRHPELLPPANLMGATTVLDLSLSQDVLFSKMRSTLRNYVRSGIRAGLEFREGGRADLDLFFTMLTSLCERRGVSPNPPHKSFYQEVWDRFSPQGSARLFFVSCQGEPVCGLFGIRMGGAFRAWRVGWSGQHGKSHPNEVLWWRTIEWAKANGCSSFDFLGVERASAMAFLAGQPLPKTSTSGMSLFKLGFGGEALVLPEARSMAYHPVLRTFLAAGGGRFLDSAWGKKLFRPLLAKAQGI